MAEETFVYSCPSCGGKVTYLEDKLKWKCDYCGNTYDALFVPKINEELPNMNGVKYTYYCYLCDNCHSKFLSAEKKDAKCTKCDTQCSGEGKETTVTRVLDLDYSVSEANDIYYNEVIKFKKQIDSEYLDKNLKLEYINCDLYNGCIKISNGNNSKKYIFMNLLIPNIEYDDYSFMYEVGNIGVKNSKEYIKDSQEKIESRIRQKVRFFTNVDDINYVDDIVNSCLENFKKVHKNSNDNDIKVENNLSVSDGVYVPIYKKIIDKENQYVFGNKSALEPLIIQFPSENGGRQKTKIYKSLASFFRMILIMSFICFWGSFQFMKQYMIIFALLLLVSFIFNLFFDKKYRYYIKTIKLSKKEYFEQIINNSNYVKCIEVKK